ncbi:MAG: peptidoglycan-binding domain-containing protein [Pseudolabrys sp.]
MRRRTTRREIAFEGAGRLATAISSYPREFVGVVMAAFAVFAIALNALFLQKGPHPAPIFAAKPLLQHEAAVAPPARALPPNVVGDSGTQVRVQLIVNIQRELARKGFYDGPADGIWGAKTDSAVRDFVQTAGVKISVEARDGLLRAITASNAKAANTSAVADAPSADPIARLITPSKRVTAVQRALSDFGYGQIKPTGVYDPDTRAAIEKFERDHKLPVTGQLSDRVVRELAAMTGRPLE